MQQCHHFHTLWSWWLLGFEGFVNVMSVTYWYTDHRPLLDLRSWTVCLHRLWSDGNRSVVILPSLEKKGLSVRCVDFDWAQGMFEQVKD